LTRGLAYNQIALWSSLEALILWWILPVLIVYRVERRDWNFLGLAIQREKRWIYVLAAGLGLVLPAFLVGFDCLLLVEFVEQVIYIGFIEELFYRGYLLQRMCNWLGDVRGLLITSFLFGLGHILSRLAQKGFTILGPASLLGFQTFLGGLLFGLIYLRARNIWLSAILHISMNMYLGRMMELLS
jgi:membrane protease YdiL (CAAX protease family)